MITRSARRLAAVLAACLLAVLPAAEAASAAPAQPSHARPAADPHGRTTFGVQPSSAKKPDARPNFSYGVTPGAAVRDHIAVWNYGNDPLTVSVYAADAINTAEGGFDLLAGGAKSKDAGSWVKIGKTRVTIPRRSRVIVPFTLTVPATVTPGDHVAGIVASLAGVRTDKKGDRVKVDQRVGARVYVRVAGELKPQLTVEGVHTSYHGTANPFGTGSATVTYTVRNIGNVRLGARQIVRVRDLFGGTAKISGVHDMAELLPGTSLRFTAKATGVLPTVRGTATVQIDPVSVRGDIKHPILPRVTRTQGFWAVPWIWAAVVLAVAGTVLVAWIRRRRRRRPGPTAAVRGPVSTKSGKTKRTPTAKAAAPVAMVLAAMVSWAGAPSAAAAAPGGLTVTPARGVATQPITLTAAAPCPAAATYVIVRVHGAGFPKDGQNVVGNAPLTTYPQGPGGGLAIPLTFTMQDYAATAGFRALHGTYTFTATCLKAPFDEKGLRDFTGSVRFVSRDTYRDGTQAKPENPAAGTPGGGQEVQGMQGGTGQGGPSAPAAPAGQSTGAPSGAPAGSAVSNAQGGTSDAPLVAAADTSGSHSALVAWSLAGFVVAFLVVAAGATQWARGRKGRAARAGSDD
ncbi:hypothetical protein ACFWVC_02350 [Streptomyces sp. NPDC058691]|uniref:hypothetical protein n=1 Tax=Streptomyces sp. NPDC058691 TaxID=3346601 RepID=UPI0036507671